MYKIYFHHHLTEKLSFKIYSSDSERETNYLIINKPQHTRTFSVCRSLLYIYKNVESYNFHNGTCSEWLYLRFWRPWMARSRINRPLSNRWKCIYINLLQLSGRCGAKRRRINWKLISSVLYLQLKRPGHSAYIYWNELFTECIDCTVLYLRWM